MHAVLTAAALASGASAVAAGTDAIESGSAADASGDLAIAVGKQASAPGPSSIALGAQARAQGNAAMAAGSNANAQGDGANAVGLNANAQGSGATSVGADTRALGAGATAAGLNASALNDRATAVGLNAVAMGLDSIASGSGAIATDAATSAFGALSTASGSASTAVGYGAQTQGSAAFAGGSLASAAADGSVALGNRATVSGVDGIALGNHATASAANSVALGANSATTADLTRPAYAPVGLGASLIAAPDPAGEVSLGSAGNERRLTNVAAGALPTDAVNVSQLSAIDGKVDAIARSGTQRYFKAEGRVDGSDDAVATGANALAAGAGASSPGADAAAVGAKARAAGTGSVALGASAVADAAHATSVGAGAVAGAAEATAIGASAVAGASNATVIGAHSAVVSDGGVALGYGASATADNVVAIGRDSVAERANTVSMGSTGQERQITNVAAGTADTDAVNVTQLKAVSDRGEATATKLEGALMYDRNADGSISRDSVTLGGDAAGNGTVIHNVAAGAADTDAVNVAQLNTVSDQGKANAAKLDGALMYDRNADGSVNLDSVSLGGSAASGGTVIHNVAAGVANTDAVNVAQLNTVSDQSNANTAKLDGALMYDQNADGSVNRDSVTLGGSAATGGTVIHNVAAGVANTDAVNVAQLNTVSDQSNANTAKLDGALMYDRNADGSVNRDSVTLGGSAASGGTVIHNVAAGVANTDAVNVAQLNTVSDQSNANTAKLDGALMYDRNADGSVNRDSVTLGAGAASGGTVIHNVAPGTADTDAVNVAQLNTVSDQSNANTAKLEGALMYDRNADGSVNLDSVSLGGSAASGGTVIHNVAAGIANTDAVNVAQLNMVSDQNTATAAKLNGALMYDQNVDGSLNRNSVTLAGDAASGGTVIHNVAAGTADTDAVNVAQLKTVSDQGEATATKLDGALMYDRNADGSFNRNSVTLGNDASGGGTVIHNVADGVDVSDAVNLGQLNAVVNGVVNNAVVNAANPFISAQGSRDTEGAVSSGVHSIAAGANARATGASATAIGASANASGNNAVALGAAANASADNSVALGRGSVADRANAVSVGAAGQERQIINVAAGVQGTDAVNVNQLQQTAGGALSQANRYTDDQIRSARRDGYGGTASALAIAGLPQAIMPGRGMFAMAGGTYGGQSALAIGMSQLSEKGTWAYKLQASTDSRGEFGASIGAGVHW
ncbi:YadA-like family protein [Paraburkholderia sp. RAU2J]|uniref:YadA family autotransporter adhesin n=1 Tax=Paraburkholderia sp. RAU2J TaxID=1938810 RepID=UPI0013158CD6|nr:YadA-like family protein [Paraburkholderia sp. RAU2J]